jgi:hypothetical protein
VVELQRIKKSTSAIPMVDPPSQPRRAIVFSWRAFASSSALHIFRFAGSGQANQHVTRRAKGRYLACENFIETIIVAGGSENAPVAGETNRRVRATVPGETHHKLSLKNVPRQPRCRHFRIQAISFPHADIARSDRRPRRSRASRLESERSVSLVHHSPLRRIAHPFPSSLPLR